MRGRGLCLAVALASGGWSARAAAELQTLSFVHLVTEEPQGGMNALYNFSFTTSGNDFVSAKVFFSLKNGARYGCGVFANARCTLEAGGQTLKLIGLSNGIEGSFSWVADPNIDNRPTEISIGVPLPPQDLDHFDGHISPPLPLPEPSGWALMIAGFGLAGVDLRRVGRSRRAQVTVVVPQRS